MTEAAQLLAELRDAGALLSVEAGRLRIRAPRGVLSDTRLADIEAHRDALLAVLSAPSVPELRQPDPILVSSDPVLDQTVANARALDPAEFAAWQAEIVAAVRYVEAGGDPDPHLAHDLDALRRIVPFGVCWACGQPCVVAGEEWCTDGYVKGWSAMETRP
ncbi:MAG: hypothetical protein M3Q71_13425 [Chloroflexota bacterium]|nr:hypothetical protein [Chloroflexota bacterium]